MPVSDADFNRLFYKQIQRRQFMTLRKKGSSKSINLEPKYIGSVQCLSFSDIDKFKHPKLA